MAESQWFEAAKRTSVPHLHRVVCTVDVTVWAASACEACAEARAKLRELIRAGQLLDAFSYQAEGDTSRWGKR